MNKNVIGYLGIEYSLDELRQICLKCHTRQEYDSNQELKAELVRRKSYHSKIYNNAKFSVFPGEIWKDLKEIAGFTDYSVSNFGRVKFKNKIIIQEDEKDKYGYLVLAPEHTKNVTHSVHVYTMIAYGFLGKFPKDGKHVHHIDNNGYNCRPENLILLDSEQHSYVHGKFEK